MEIPSISGLARLLDISRTTSRRIVDRLIKSKIVRDADSLTRPLRKPVKDDYFDRQETLSTDEVSQAAFMEWMVREELPPGTRLSEAKIARKLNISNTSVREFLISLSRHGFIHKEPQRYWVIDGFTREYASEVLEVRLLFDLKAIEKITALPDDNPFWARLLRSRTRHLNMLEITDEDYLAFSELDRAFHRLIHSAAQNRFMHTFQDVISLIFYYQYRWNKNSQQGRKEVALHEHLAIIEALLMKDTARAQKALRHHLITAEQSLLASVNW